MLILLLSGPLAVGKSSVADVLVADCSFTRLRTGTYLVELARKHGKPITRSTLQKIGDDLDEETDFRWPIERVAMPTLTAAPTGGSWLLDSVRKPRQVQHFREQYGDAVIHAHLIAEENVLEDRYERRRASGGDYSQDVSYQIAIQHPNELAARSLGSIADFTLDLTSTTAADIATRIVASLKNRDRRPCGLLY